MSLLAAVVQLAVRKPSWLAGKPPTLFGRPTLYSCTSGTAREPLVTVARACRSGFLLPPAPASTPLKQDAAFDITLQPPTKVFEMALAPPIQSRFVSLYSKHFGF
jgi:hypothetical protein